MIYIRNQRMDAASRNGVLQKMIIIIFYVDNFGTNTIEMNLNVIV